MSAADIKIGIDADVADALREIGLLIIVALTFVNRSRTGGQLLARHRRRRGLQ